MQNIGRYLAIGGVVVAAACARSVSTGNSNFTSGGSGSGGGPGGINVGTASPGGGPGGGGIDLRDGSVSNVPSDGAPMLAGKNSVGLCTSGRTCMQGECDQLQENGQHEYVEQHPDDGSQIPFKDVPTAQAAFSAKASGSGGPCIVEPPDGSLFPNNWVRARIRVRSAGSGPMINRIQIHADRQKQDLIVYTESPTWEIPKDIWQNLAASTWGENITVTVTQVPAKGGGTPVSSKVSFQIAPAFANGEIIYWTNVGSTLGQAWLESFGVGDENVAVALTVPQIQWQSARAERGDLQSKAEAAPLKLPAGSAACIGCHVAVPDRKTVTFNEDWPWDGVAAMVDPNDTGKIPPWLTPGGAQALGMPWLGMMSFSPHIWNDLNEHLMVVAMQNESTWGTNNLPEGGTNGAPFPPWGFQSGNEWDVAPASQLGWIDLSTNAPPVLPGANGATGDELSLGMAANYGTSWGIIQRAGDTSGAASPTWSHLTGDTIVYTSTNASKSGRMDVGTADLWSVPFNNGAGGAASPIAGASDPKWNEFYPSYSPDDQFIAFNRTPVADNMYYDPASEIYVVPAAGGTAARLAANDAPSCMGVTSPGLNNSWAKWAPEYPVCEGTQYYWLVFSSSREKIARPSVTSTESFPDGRTKVASQLYLTALTVTEGGLRSYPAVYIWNQHTVASGVGAPNDGMPQSNHTPQWEGIDLPPPPPPPGPPTAILPPQ